MATFQCRGQRYEPTPAGLNSWANCGAVGLWIRQLLPFSLHFLLYKTSRDHLLNLSLGVNSTECVHKPWRSQEEPGFGEQWAGFTHCTCRGLPPPHSPPLPPPPHDRPGSPRPPTLPLPWFPKGPGEGGLPLGAAEEVRRSQRLGAQLRGGGAAAEKEAGRRLRRARDHTPRGPEVPWGRGAESTGGAHGRAL